MNAKSAMKAVIETASDQELIAIFAALAHPDKVAIGSYFSKLATDLAEKITQKVGEVES